MIEEVEKDIKKIDEFRKIKRYVQQKEKVSTSHLQRKFKIGYNKASRFIEYMEADGTITERDKYGFRTVIKRIYKWNL